jgi:hypothetical protein
VAGIVSRVWDCKGNFVKYHQRLLLRRLNSTLCSEKNNPIFCVL